MQQALEDAGQAAAQERERIDGGEIAYTLADLDELCAGAARFDGELHLTKRCTRMLERVMQAFPTAASVGAPETVPDSEGRPIKVQWIKKKGTGDAHSDTVGWLSKGGGSEAFKKLQDTLRDSSKPWYYAQQAKDAPGGAAAEGTVDS